ncbi:hydratase [Pseudomonas qingdaonensis]|nr:hydratase [Pseudomonas qingdaonensis]
MPAPSVPVSPVRIAVIQFDPQVGLDQCDNNLCKGLQLAEEAVHDGANLIVLPELANTGYTFETRAEAYAHAETLDEGPSIKTWRAFAREHQVYLVAGFAERDGLKLYDSAVLFGPDGLLGHYRKAHLWNQEKLWFSPGDLGFPVFETPIGRIGLMICWDVWFPEVPRLLALQGADIICSLNNWVWTPPRCSMPAAGAWPRTSPSLRPTSTMSTLPPPTASAASVAGVFWGSLIAGTNGWPLGKVGGAEDECILYADVDLSTARSAPVWNSLNDLPRDRRTDCYGAMLGYDQHPALPR